MGFPDRKVQFERSSQVRPILHGFRKNRRYLLKNEMKNGINVCGAFCFKGENALGCVSEAKLQCTAFKL